jgi:hypothetical protein
MKSLLFEFQVERLFINGLTQSWAELLMHGDRTPDDLICEQIGLSPIITSHADKEHRLARTAVTAVQRVQPNLCVSVFSVRRAKRALCALTVSSYAGEIITNAPTGAFVIISPTYEDTGNRG